MDQRYLNQGPSGEVSPTQTIPQYVFTSNYKFPPVEKKNHHMGGNYTLAPMQMQHTFLPAYGGFYGGVPVNYGDIKQGVPSNPPPVNPNRRNMNYVIQGNQHEFVYEAVGNHRKSQSVPGVSNSRPLMTKFQTMQSSNFTMKPSKSSGGEFSTKSGKGDNTTMGEIKYPINQLSKLNENIPYHKSEELRSKIYPSIETKKYTTSAIDPIRNYLTVFEYMVNNHWIIWDYETGFVHLTGIWKASINGTQQESKTRMKADIVRLLESTPKQYQSYIKRIRGGFLKIQGTWLPFDLCRILARRFCYHIRYELVPIFGEDFPQYCLSPNDKGYGELKLTEITNISPKIVHSPFSESVQKQNESTFGVFDSNSIDSTPTDKNINSYFLLSHDKSTKGSAQKKRKVSMSLPSPPRHMPMSSAESLKSPLVLNMRKFSNEEDSPSQASLVHIPDSASRDSTAHSSISLTDMMEIVNASKCLQSLSRSGSFSQSSPPHWETSNNRGNSGYTVATEPPNISDRSNSEVSDGISSILLAADLSKGSNTKPQIPSNEREDKTFRGRQIRINDMLT